jgi:hypothetical protein
LLIERREAELCAFDPGFGDDLIVTINDPVTFAHWHLGLIEWTTALRSGAVTVTGPAELRRALPNWNDAPAIMKGLRSGDAPRKRAPAAGYPPVTAH